MTLAKHCAESSSCILVGVITLLNIFLSALTLHRPFLEPCNLIKYYLDIQDVLGAEGIQDILAPSPTLWILWPLLTKVTMNSCATSVPVPSQNTLEPQYLKTNSLCTYFHIRVHKRFLDRKIRSWHGLCKFQPIVADHSCRRVHRSGGSCLAYETFCLFWVWSAAGRTTLHYAGWQTLLPTLLWCHVCRILRLVRGAHWCRSRYHIHLSMKLPFSMLSDFLAPTAYC